MMRRLLIAIALLAICSGTAADAAPSRGRATPSKRTGVRAKAPASKAAAKRDSTVRLAGAPRRLEDIHIEGEIPAPQVLFVTARDQRRFTRFHHQRYLRSSLQVGETTQLPTRIALTSHPPDTAGAP